MLDALRSPGNGAYGEPAAMVGTRIAENTLHASATAVLAHSHGLLRNHARLDELISALRSERAASVADTWRQDIEQTEERLRLGASVARRNVKQVLGADTHGMGGTDNEGDVEMLPGEATGLNYDLQTSLQYAERGIKRMAKAVPSEKS